MTLVSLVTKHNLQMLIRESTPRKSESSFGVAGPALRAWGEEDEGDGKILTGPALL